MAADIHLEEQELQFEIDQKKSISYNAAILIQDGHTEEAAMAKAKDINVNQQAADNDPTGTLGTLAEAQSPEAPAGKEAQTHAIASRLFETLK